MNKLLISILFLSTFLNIFGLFPNFYLHQKEPGLLDAADHILINSVSNLNFDPFVPPDPFRYGSIMYHFHALVRGSTAALMYNTHKLSGYDFRTPQAFSSKHLKDMYTKDTIFLLQDHLTWVSRFTTAIFGVLAVFLTYLISLKLLRKKGVAYLSALALSVTPLFVRESHYATPDIPQLVLILLAFLFSLNLLEKPTLKNYLLAGFFIGLQTSLKYFPISLLPFLYCHLLITRWKFFNQNFLLAILAIFLGYLTGQPYIFVEFHEIWQGFTLQLNWYTPDQLANKFFLERILPSYLHFFHFNFAISHSILIFPILAGLLGLIYGWFQERKAILIILIVPIFNSFFISLYLAQVYEYLPLPSLPFIAILTGLGLWLVLSWFRLSPYKIIVFAMLLILVFGASLFSNINSDYACSKQINPFESRLWIKNNIPIGTKFAYQSGVLIADAWPESLKSNKETSFSITELQEQGILYSAIEKGYANPFTNWEADLLFVPKKIANNQFYNLVSEQYQKQTSLVKSFEKPDMCTDSQIFIYKLPPKLDPATNLVKLFSFDNQADYKMWWIDNKTSEAVTTFDQDEGNSQTGSIYYHYQRGIFNKYRSEWFYYSNPIFSPFLEAQENRKYSLSGFVKQQKFPTKLLPDGYLRLEFYNSKKDKPILRVITPRSTQYEWQQLSVSAISPANTKFIRVGFQSLAYNDFGSFWIDDVQISD